MVSIGELIQKFGPTHAVAPWGECIVVQGTEFDPDWEGYLGDLGYRCHFGDLDGHAAVFVPLKKSVVPGKVVYVPKKPVAAVDPIVQSNVVEVKEMNEVLEEKKLAVKKQIPGSSNNVADDFIIELWTAYVTYAGIKKAVQEKFPSDHISTEYRIVVLKNSGRLKSRHKEKNAVVAGEKKARREVLQKRGGNLWPKMYSVDEDDLLVKLWNQEPRLIIRDLFVEFNKVFPDKRTVGAVGNRLTGLQNEGRIQPRWNIKKKDPKATNAVSAIKSEKSIEVIPEETEHSPECKNGVPDLVEKRLQVLYEGFECLSKLCDDLTKKFDVLSQAYDANSKGYVELRAKFEDLQVDLETKIRNVAASIAECPTEEDLEAVRKSLACHEHSEKSGKALFPLEASS